MATLLYRLGRASFRHRTRVLALWLAMLALGGVAAGLLHGQTSERFTIPASESQTALDHLGERFPGAHLDGGTANAVFAAPEGRKITHPDVRAAVESTLQAVRAHDDRVVSVSDPYGAKTLSAGRTHAMAQIGYSVAAQDVGETGREALQEAAAQARQAGLEVEFSGPVYQENPGVGPMEAIGVLVAFVVLFITLGSMVAAGLPILTALIGVMVGLCGILAATGFTELSSATPVLALMLGLAVGIDYALFIVSRYRQELAAGHPHDEAASRAVGTAGGAVVFAGLTVVIALVGLVVIGIPFLTAMGLAAAGTVTISVLIALTLLPAMLGFAGARIGPAAARHRVTRGQRWGRFVTGRPALVLSAGLLAVGAMAVPALSLQLNMPDDGVAATDTTQRAAYDMIEERFGPGANGPLLVEVDTGKGGAGVAATEATRIISAFDGVAAVAPPTVNAAGDTAIIVVMPKTGPTDETTKELVTAIRGTADDFRQSQDAELRVTGQVAVNIDLSEAVADALPTYLLVVVGLAIVLLTVVFRSVLVPLKAALGFLLSVAASFGAVVAVFQWGWLADVFGVHEAAPVPSLLPIILIGVLFGLAMDYEVFLVSRIHEAHTHGSTPREAIEEGIGHSARVITAAALIMFAVFAGFVMLDNPMIKAMAFGLAVGVLVDAFIVRMALIPAAMALLGKAAWWIPRALDRRLPHLDIEGTDLESALAPPLPDKEPAGTV
ncbi:RND superfamily putative drug exporter [Actinocorallia herbida]|uniref:RND superfamily putative drug exporter n=1 Tax=Actinocorallia herbida TaxID=58109 RepID=A0A3N1D384_9ACTN|nr:MMPL family transporter [Actinocorallia herbida]ROO87979.1 RND superfamily putative drug exporter [Actinocorallia herbida]